MWCEDLAEKGLDQEQGEMGSSSASAAEVPWGIGQLITLRAAYLTRLSLWSKYMACIALQVDYICLLKILPPCIRYGHGYALNLHGY